MYDSGDNRSQDRMSRSLKILTEKSNRKWSDPNRHTDELIRTAASYAFTVTESIGLDSSIIPAPVDCHPVQYGSLDQAAAEASPFGRY